MKVDDTPLLGKERKRKQLEAHGWRVALKNSDREELKQAARVAQSRAARLREVAAESRAAGSTLRVGLERLRRIDEGFRLLEIGVSGALPSSLRFSMQPDHVACLAAYRELMALARARGLDMDGLDAVQRIGTLHASALYERWCLVKTLGILIEIYGFHPAAGWQDALISVVTTWPAKSFSMGLLRRDLKFGAVLEVQPELPNGRRPDFRLRCGYLPADPTRTVESGMSAADRELLAGQVGIVRAITESW